MRKATLFILAFFVCSVQWVYAQCDPSGCAVGACYCISDATVTDERGTLFDDGGPDFEYQEGASRTEQVISYLFNIEPASGSDTIVLDFVQFQVESSVACEYDHLEILDGGISRGIYCGANSPGVVVCTNGSVTIRWFSDPNTVADGFEMRWYTDSLPEPQDEDPGTGTTGYCEAQGGSCTYTGLNTDPDADYIPLVEIESDSGLISNATECDSYADYSNVEELYVPMTAGSPYGLNVDRIINYDFGVVHAFVDWNEDFDFDDPNETYTGSTVVGIVGAPQITIIPPVDVTTGKKRLRIRTALAPSVPDACGAETYGEVEDYAIIIGEPIFCAENPSPEMGAEQLCQKGISFSWEKNDIGAEPEGYIFYLGTNNPPSNVIDSLDLGDTTAFMLPDTLEANTKYFWKAVPYNADGSASGCDPWEFTTTADGDPDVSVEIDGEAKTRVTACVGVDLPLQATSAGGTGAVSYQWSGNDISKLNRVDTASVVFFSGESKSNAYVVTATDELGCFGSNEIVVSMEENASVGDVSSNIPLCFQTALEIASSNFRGALQWQQFNDGVWVDLEGETNALYRNESPSSGSRYRVLARTENCADTSDSFLVEIFDQSEAPGISSSTQSFGFCSGQSLQLISGVELNNNWNTGSQNDSIEVNTPGEYTVFYVDDNGCNSAVSSVIVEEFAIPSEPVIEQVENGVINLCTGTTLELSIAATTDSIAWNNDPQTNSNTFTVSEQGSVSVSVTNDAGCTTISETASIEERPIPETPEILIENGLNGFCDGETLELNANTDEPSVEWNGDPSITTSTITTDTAGTFTLTAISGFGCASEAASVEVELFANPEQPIITKQDSHLVSSVTTGELQWYREDGTPVDGEMDAVFENAPEGSYYIEVTDPETGCTSRSDIIAGVRSFEDLLGEVSIWPNPVTQGHLVRISHSSQQEIKSIQLLNTLGQTLKQVQDTDEISTAGVLAGTYFVKLTFHDNDYFMNIKLIVE